MAFFEQLGKKLSDAGQGVAQSSRNAVDIAKLNSAVSDKKKQIAQAYSAIGEKYYELHKDSAEEELSALVSNVNQLFAEIHDCENQIKTIRGVAKCANCGADIPTGAAFCSVCGAPAPEPERPAAPEGTRECPNCHKFVPVGNKFCTGCGAKMED